MQQTLSKDEVMSGLGDAITKMFGTPRDEVVPDATWEELDIDSLDLVELAQVVEEDYDVQLAAADVKEVKTLGEAVDLICSRLQ
jgi:acyl carrier protein